MSWLMMSSRVPGKSSRSRVESVDFKGNVASLKSKASRTLDVSIHEIELIYSGQRLKDGELLSKYGVKPGVTVHVLKKVISEEQEVVPDKLDNAAIQQVVRSLQTALINPAYRTVMLESAESSETLIATTPGLDKDPVAMAMLQNPELLAHIIENPRQVHRVIEAHPCLGQAALAVAAAVKEESSRSGGAGRSSARSTYSLDQMSDDEDSASSRPRTNITRSQLSAALAASFGTGTPSGSGTSAAASSSSASASSSSAQSAATSSITAAALGQALQSSQPPQPQEQSDSPVVTEAQLQQLRDMGITDEAVARRALEASGGDIQAALGLIFDM